jgi:hypothetical protein
MDLCPKWPPLFNDRTEKEVRVLPFWSIYWTNKYRLAAGGELANGQSPWATPFAFLHEWNGADSEAMEWSEIASILNRRGKTLRT